MLKRVEQSLKENGEVMKESERRFVNKVEELRSEVLTTVQGQVQAMESRVDEMCKATAASDEELKERGDKMLSELKMDLKLFRVKYDAKIIKVTDDMAFYKKHLDVVDLDRLPKV